MLISITNIHLLLKECWKNNRRENYEQIKNNFRTLSSLQSNQ